MNELMSTNEQIKTLLELCLRSEKRIDTTNTMIDKLTAVISNLTLSYEAHLKQLEDNRNEIAKQNTMLMEQYRDVVGMQERLTRALIERINVGSVTNNNTNSNSLRCQ